MLTYIFLSKYNAVRECRVLFRPTSTATTLQWLKPVGGIRIFQFEGGGSRRSFSIRGGVGSRRSFSIRGGVVGGVFQFEGGG